MKSFKKFVLISLLPIILIATIAIIISKSFEDLNNINTNIFVFGYFSIISFCYVYIYENLKIKRISLKKNYIYSTVSVLVLTLTFSSLWEYFSFDDFNFTIVISESALAVCLFLLNVLVFEIYQKSAQKEVLTINEKPFFFVKLALKVILVLTIMESGILLIEYYSALQTLILFAYIFLLNLQITITSFIILGLLYRILFFRRNIFIGVLFASVVSCWLTCYFDDIWKKEFFFNFIIIFPICLFCCSIIIITLLYRTRIQSLSLSFSKKETEYLQLKSQINPHFLFNNLNTLIAFIESNPQKAIEFGEHLSNVYRHYLKSENNDFVKLDDEINFIKEYTAIFKAKFENGFTFKLINESDENQYILSLSLQELIDNIFKHNILDSENPIAIELTINKNELTIKNTKHKKEALHSTKKGIENINKRYDLLTKKEIVVIESDTVFEVRIPILYLTK